MTDRMVLILAGGGSVLYVVAVLAVLIFGDVRSPDGWENAQTASAQD